MIMISELMTLFPTEAEEIGSESETPSYTTQKDYEMLLPRPPKKRKVCSYKHWCIPCTTDSNNLRY